MACTLVTFRARSALRDVAAALDLPVELVEQAEQALEAEQRSGGAAGDTLGLVAELCRQIDGVPRHLGQHSGGMIITRAPLAERLPTEPAAMAGRMVVQWDKDDLDALGLLKIDVLALGMLSALRRSLALVSAWRGARDPRWT
jgi:error-prone DNA polymerase